MVDRKTPNRDAAGDDYRVGYGKPPKGTRFKRGRSGNPKGRPQGVSNFKTDLKATLEAAVSVTRDGKPRKISTQEAMLLRLREKALGGDSRALDRLILLAQAYNNEELALSTSLSDDDADLLQIYEARVLSRAAAASDSPKNIEDSVENLHSTGRLRRSRRLKSN